MLVWGLTGCGGGADTHEDGRPASSSLPAAPPDPDTTLDAAAVRVALPDLPSMPAGWKPGVMPSSVREVPWTERCRPGNASRDCTLHSSRGLAQYRPPGDAGTVDISLAAYPDRRTAGTAFKNVTGSRAAEGREVSMPAVGNESGASSRPRAPYGGPSVSMTVRVGTAVATLTYQDADKNKDSAQVLLALTRMQAQRLLQAEQGRTPTAAAR
ncbi:hypothetical protein [Streptomyces thioluteus]|uniref:hypothetical protein n=1 Tax=Streptomyces thioluteus TaxID=66431 RepID=UPI0031F02B01